MPAAPEVVRRAPRGWTLVDLHNHTASSYDASNTLAAYEAAHARGAFHVLALTDHNRVDGARRLAARASFPVVVGQEIDTADGELIGLFLGEPVPAGLGAVETARAVRRQGGLVYAQHPFYRWIPHRIALPALEELRRRDLLDVVEGLNGGPFTRRPDGEARRWAAERGVPCGAGSDAHHPRDIGTCVVAVPPLRPAELTPASLLGRLRRGVLVERRRRPAPALADRGRHLAREAWRCRVRGGARKPRLPPPAGGG